MASVTRIFSSLVLPKCFWLLKVELFQDNLLSHLKALGLELMRVFNTLRILGKNLGLKGTSKFFKLFLPIYWKQFNKVRISLGGKDFFNNSILLQPPLFHLILLFDSGVTTHWVSKFEKIQLYTVEGISGVVACLRTSNFSSNPVLFSSALYSSQGIKYYRQTYLLTSAGTFLVFYCDTLVHINFNSPDYFISLSKISH